MKTIKNRYTKGIILILVVIFNNINLAFSCSTPVFRYALEMWPAYSYSVEVIHNGNLSSSQQKALDYLKNSSSFKIPVNLKVSETTDNISKESSPIIKLYYPKEQKIEGVIWEGELTNENAKKIIDSPARSEIVKNIQKGDAAVWVFLESGNTERDSKQLQILKSELKRLSGNLKLAESATDVSGKPLDIDLINTGVTFSLVKVKQNDPLEEVFIKVLLGTEADLKFFKKVPLAFPLFGQGRALYALAGAGIKDNNIETACNTIIGWCSCTIKDDNPGTDLLIMADWEKAIGDSSWIKKEEVPDITGISGFISDKEEIEEKAGEKIVIAEKVETSAKPIKSEEKIEIENKSVANSQINVEEQESTISPLLRNSLITIILLLFVITSALLILRIKTKRKSEK
jgi:hypothetical protein